MVRARTPQGGSAAPAGGQWTNAAVGARAGGRSPAWGRAIGPRAVPLRLLAREFIILAAPDVTRAQAIAPSIDS